MATLAWANSAIQAIPRITNEFHSLADVGWYASAYQFGRYAFQIHIHRDDTGV